MCCKYYESCFRERPPFPPIEKRSQAIVIHKTLPHKWLQQSRTSLENRVCSWFAQPLLHAISGPWGSYDACAPTCSTLVFQFFPRK
jgi:hypothetical protein